MTDILDPRVEYGEQVKSSDTSVFYVEVNWPDTRTAAMKKDGWTHDPNKYNRYPHTAFNDRRRPGNRKFFSSTVGTFDHENADVADARSRVTFGGAASDRQMGFYDPSDAFAYADRLREFGELASNKDQHQGAHIAAHKKAAKTGLRVRVVHERRASFVRVVTPKGE